MTGLFIQSVGTYLPERESAHVAVASGAVTETLVKATGIEQAVVSAQHPAHLAACAARVALGRTKVGPSDISLILYASLFDQVHGLWAPASYVQRVAVGNDCLAIEVRQVSNGAMAALEMARAYLLADPERQSALVATGDRLTLPHFNRWSSDPGTVYADGGTAMVVSARDGFARVRTMVSVSDAQLEGMHRLGDAFGEPPPTAPTLVDLAECKNNYLDEAGPLALSRITRGQDMVMELALKDAEVGIDDIQHFCLPHMGVRRLRAAFYSRFGIAQDKTTWSWSSRVGHLGPGDPIASLDYLAVTGRLRIGDLCLIASVGAGFTWTVMVLEIVADAPGVSVKESATQ